MNSLKNKKAKKNKTNDIIKYRKEYYKQNKDKIKQMMNTERFCNLCCENVKISKWLRHCESKKHTKYLKIDGNKKDEDEIHNIKQKKIIEQFEHYYGVNNEKTEELKNFIKQICPLYLYE